MVVRTMGERGRISYPPRMAKPEIPLTDEQRRLMTEFDRNLTRSRDEDSTLEISTRFFYEMFGASAVAIGVPDYADESKFHMSIVSEGKSASKSIEGTLQIDSRRTIELDDVPDETKAVLPEEGLEFIFSNGSGRVLETSGYENQRRVSYIVACAPAREGSTLRPFTQKEAEIFERFSERVASKLCDQHKMTIDSLTGLYAKRYGAKKLDDEYQRAMRDDNSMTVMVIDMDHFKDANDTKGHKYGDQVLRKLGEVIRGNTRPYDIAVRDGGEEIMVIMQKTTLEQGARRAEQIRKLIESEVRLKDGLAHTVSIGVASFPYVQNAATVKEHADRAMYAAKHLGRNQV